MTDPILLTIVGIVVGIIGTLVGIGGGFIMVPLLISFFQLPPQFAVGTSMCIIAANAVSGTLVYTKQKRVHYRTGIVMAGGAIPGAVLGAYLLRYVPKEIFEIGFGVILAVVSGSIVFKEIRLKSRHSLPKAQNTELPQINRTYAILLSFCVGTFASLAGVGGGIIHTPLLIYLFGFHPFIAIPTSHFILAITSCAAAVSHGIIGEVWWEVLPFMGIGAVVGAQIGGRISHIVPTQWIIRILIIVMLVLIYRLLIPHLFPM